MSLLYLIMNKCNDGGDGILFLEEICTLVIAEAFPEDGGLFCCTASNPYGSVSSTAQLTVTAGVCQTQAEKDVQTLTQICKVVRMYVVFCKPHPDVIYADP